MSLSRLTKRFGLYSKGGSYKFFLNSSVFFLSPPSDLNTKGAKGGSSSFDGII